MTTTDSHRFLQLTRSWRRDRGVDGFASTLLFERFVDSGWHGEMRLAHASDKEPMRANGLILSSIKG